MRSSSKMFIAASAMVLAWAMTGVSATAAPSDANAAPPIPSSIAALGDSMTRAYNVCGWFRDCPSRSWATGGDGSISNSHYQRIRAKNPAINGKAFSNARSGAEMAALNEQAQTAVSQGAQYVTVLMGHNDACADSEASMTPVATFETQFRQGMTTLHNGLPSSSILVSSIVNIHRLWEIGHTSSAARDRWALTGNCKSLLANPASTAPADVDRRNRVKQRVIDFNAVLARVCAETPNCKFDNNVLFNYPFTLSHVSSWDYFHADIDGQRVIADLLYTNGYNW